MLKDKRGFTLLELVISMGFFAIISMGVMSLLIQNMKLVSYTQTQASAMTIAFNKWSQLLSSPYTSVLNEPRTALGNGYDREVGVTEQTLSDNSKQKNVQITVYKTGGNSIYSLNEIKSQISVSGDAGTTTGAVMYFNLSSCPTGWIEANGQNGTPDLRGEFIRGLDRGRGVDTGRTLASWQTDMFKSHTHATYASDDGGRNDGTTAQAGQTYLQYGFTTLPTGGTETRPRNVALLTCVKQ